MPGVGIQHWRCFIEVPISYSTKFENVILYKKGNLSFMKKGYISFSCKGNWSGNWSFIKNRNLARLFLHDFMSIVLSCSVLHIAVVNFQLSIASGKCKILWSKFLKQLIMDWKDLISFRGVCLRKTDQCRCWMLSACCRCSLNFCSIKYWKYLQKYCLTESNQLLRLEPSTYQSKPTAGTPQQLKKRVNIAV